jgi:SAM-dependent methyltransferase
MKKKFIEINCPVCESKQKNILFHNVEHSCNVLDLLGAEFNEVYNIYRCFECTHSYLSPILSNELITHYYHILNSEYYDQSKFVTDPRAKENIYYAKMIKEYVPKGNILEIGSGFGFLLNELNNEGFNVYGVEPSPYASSYAKRVFGLNILNGFLSEDSFENDYFDCIILMDVLEHLDNPNNLFKIINLKLKQGGIVYCLTGNIDAIYPKILKKRWWYISSLEHISFFNKNSIKTLMENNNMQVIKIKNTGHSISLILNLRAVIVTIVKFSINLITEKYKYYQLAFDHIIVLGTKK